MEPQIVSSSIDLSRVEARSRCWAASGLIIVGPARFVPWIAKGSLPGREDHLRETPQGLDLDICFHQDFKIVAWLINAKERQPSATSPSQGLVWCSQFGISTTFSFDLHLPFF